MTDEQARIDAAAESTQDLGSPGQMLRAGRERHNLTLEQVAKRLHLRQQVVADLERDQYSKYVSSTFARGYLRAYARLVEIDEEVVLASYNAMGLEEKMQPMQSFSRRTRQQSHDNRLMLVTYIIGALIIGSAVVFWLQNSQGGNGNNSGTGQPNPTSVAERLVEAQDTQVDIEQTPVDQESSSSARAPIFVDTNLLEQRESDLQSEGASIADDTQETEQEGETTPVDTTTPEVASEPKVEEPQSVSEDTSAGTNEAAIESNSFELPAASLVLVFSGDAWIRIEDATGEAIGFGVKTDGHVSALDGQPPYDISLGAPEHVTLYYQGEQIDLSSYRAGRLARLTVPSPDS